MPGMDEVSVRVARLFGLAEPAAMEYRERGAMGEIYYLATDQGDFAVKRLLSEVPSEERAQYIAAFMRRCAGAGVPVPAIRATPAGHIIGVDEAGQSWSCAQWIDGRTPTAGDDDASHWLMRQAALIHGLAQEPEPGEELDPWFHTAPDTWHELIDRANTAGLGCAQGLAGRAEELMELSRWSSAVDIGDLIVSHNDLQLSNMMICGTDRWLLDWDNTGAQEPWREVGALLLHSRHTPEQGRSLLRTYRDAGGREVPRDSSVFAMVMCSVLNFLYVQAEVLCDPSATLADRDFARPIVADLLSSIPSRADLDSYSLVLFGR